MKQSITKASTSKSESRLNTPIVQPQNTNVDEFNSNNNKLNDKKKEANLIREDFISETSEKVILSSPYYFYQNLQAMFSNEKNFDVYLFRNKYSSLFWNCIWYFKMFKFPLNFVLPKLEVNIVESDYFANLKLDERVSNISLING